MASGTVSCTLTFTFVAPTFVTGPNPVAFTLDLNWVDHIGPIRTSPIVSGNQFSGNGWCKRKAVSEGLFTTENIGNVLLEFNGGIGLRAHLDCVTNVVMLLKSSFPFCEGFHSCLVDLSLQINGATGEEDHL